MEFYQYPKCGTCKKAAKFLVEKEQLLEWMENSGLEPKRFFNTSGKVYQEMGLKNRVNTLSKEEAAELLSQNGMLIKRPLLINGSQVLVGFKESDYERLV